MASSVLTLLALALSPHLSGVAATQLEVRKHHKQRSSKYGIAGVVRPQNFIQTYETGVATLHESYDVTDYSPQPCSKTIPLPGSDKPMPAVGFIACCTALEHLSGSLLIDDAMNYLKHGGRLLDTAQLYGNEGEIGTAVKRSGIPREQIWVTTKIWPMGFPKNGIREWVASKVDQSLRSLDLDYIDVMYIHAGPAAAWTPLSALTGKFTVEQDAEIWKGLIDAKRAGKVRNIGVCLHTQSEIEHLKLTTGEAPAVSYFMYSPFMPSVTHDYMSWLQSEGIAVSIYGMLNFKFMGDHSHAQLMAAQSVASQHSNVTFGQAVLRWALDQNFAFITPLSHSQYVKEDLDCSSDALTSSDLQVLAAAPKWDCHTIDSVQLLMGCAP